jgi:3-oxoacyl-[acyl-carrier-protein] synthase-1
VTSSEPVGIVGAGARASLGRSLPAISAAVRASIRNVGEHPHAIDPRGRRLPAAIASWLPSWIEGAARFVALGKNAAKEALAPLRRVASDAKIRVLVGLPDERPGRPEDLDDAMVAALGKDAPWAERVESVTPIPFGHAASLLAIEDAVRAIRNGDVDLCLAGGVDSYLDGDTMQWLENTGRVLRAPRAFGFTPGEGAGFCLLASQHWIAEIGVDRTAEIVEVGSADEPAPFGSKRICTGDGLSRAMGVALQGVRRTGGLIDTWIGDLNGEPHRADEAGFALSRAADVMDRAPVVQTPAAFLGDVGAASGALFAGLVVASGASRYERGVTKLVWSSSERGKRAAAVIRTRAATTHEEDV